MSFDQLPHEVIERILLSLRPLDRLSSALTCRLWARAIRSPQLLEDVWLLMCSSEMHSLLPAVMANERQYINLRLFGVDLEDFNQDQWTRIGGQLRQLELIKCTFNPHILYPILQRCPLLESLKLTGYSKQTSAFDEMFTPPEGCCLDGVRESLRNVRAIVTDLILEPEDLDHLLYLMPNATSWSLESSEEGFHRANPLPCIQRADRMITKLDIRSTVFIEEDLIEFLRKSSECLQDLRLSCGYFSAETYSAISDCAKLRHLYLEEAVQFSDAHMQKLVNNAPDLESLEITTCSMPDVSLARLSVLRKLRRLSLAFCRNMSRAGLCSLGNIPTLEHLDVQGIPLNSVVIQSLESLNKLRTIKLLTGIDPMSIEIICENFKKLEELVLGDCGGLSDRDGVRLGSLKHLRKLRIDEAVGLTDRTFIDGLRFLGLQCLRVRKCRLTDVGLSSINAAHGRLKNLELLECENITDVGLTTLLKREPFLESLVLFSCHSLTEKCVEELESYCPRLQSLRLQDCPISARVVEEFRERRPLVDIVFAPRSLQTITVGGSWGQYLG